MRRPTEQLRVRFILQIHIVFFFRLYLFQNIYQPFIFSPVPHRHPVIMTVQPLKKKGYQHVVEALGDSFLNKDGSIDRKKLAALIFQNKEAVETMNAIIHPMAWEEIRYAINHSDKEIIVVEAALYDDEHNAMFDEIWYVYTSVENRIKRLMASRGYSEEKCRGIMANQASEDDYRSFATRVLDNNGGIEDIRKQIASFLGKED